MLHSLRGRRRGRSELRSGAEVQRDGTRHPSASQARCGESAGAQRGRMSAAAGRLLALALTFGLLCNTKALSLSKKNSTLVASNLNSQDGEFYDYEGRRCKMCPAGYYVFRHCETTGTESTCEPCSNDSFTTHLNQFHACVPCKICRPLDQVTLKPCSGTSNAECACKEGTFCSPDHPCETCHKCKPGCPDGEKMVQPCTPQSDILCMPIATSSPIPTSSPTPSSGNNNILLWLLLLLGIAVVCIILFPTCYYQRNHQCCFRDHTRTRADSIRSKTLLWLQTKLTRGQPESEDNEHNTQVDLASQIQPGPSATRQPDETVPLQKKKCIPIEEKKRKLVPANGKDPIDALRLSFLHIVDVVPLNKWRSYMMVLGLTDNEIEIAKTDHKDSVVEQHILMLQTWLEKNGKKASLDILLHTLCDPAVNLRGVELKIRETLISRDLYVYEE